MSKNMAPTNDKLINEINYLKVLLRLRNYNYTIKIWDTWKYDLWDTFSFWLQGIAAEFLRSRGHVQ